MSGGTRGPAAVVFDLDGVLIDSERTWDRARREVAAQNGATWSEDATRAMMGMSSTEWSRYMHDRLGVALPAEEINELVVQRLLAAYEHHLPLRPGAVAAVRRAGGSWPLGLASSANRAVIDAVLAAGGLSGAFAATVSAEEVVRGKPAPDVYLAAAEALALDPRTCAAVEDSTNGLRAAAAAGMLVIAAPTREFPPARDALALAGLVVHSLQELQPEAIRRAYAADS
jgi:HAD superfamily hydrolase (TIGR01509 family)